MAGVVRLNPEYLRETSDLIKSMAGQSRRARRGMWKFWIQNAERMQNMQLPERRNVFGGEMYRRGHNGYAEYAKEEIK